jgi:hypothetical protein
MASYLLETYAAGLGAEDVANTATRARAAAATLTRDGMPVRHLRSFLVPADEMFLHFFEAPSADAVGQLASIAELEVERVVETIANPTPPRRKP